MAAESPYSTRNKLLQVLNDQHFARINTYYDSPDEREERKSDRVIT